MNTMLEKEIAEIVSYDYRTADVFEKYGLDFCCGGHKTVREACAKHDLDLVAVGNDLKAVIESRTEEIVDFNRWPLDLLIDHIVEKHHRYVESNIPLIRQYLAKIAKVHDSNHPELVEVEKLFFASSGELAKHMKKEELMLFPFIKKMVWSKAGKGAMGTTPFGSVENPIAVMLQEHQTEGDRLHLIADLTGNYKVPDDACNTYLVALSKLKAFETDLHIHIHLENNVLFPKAIAMEKELNNKSLQ